MRVAGLGPFRVSEAVNTLGLESRSLRGFIDSDIVGIWSVVQEASSVWGLQGLVGFRLEGFGLLRRSRALPLQRLSSLQSKSLPCG